MMLIRVTLDTVISSSQCQETTPLKMPSLLSRQSMRLLQVIINLTVMLKWMLILLIKQLVSLVRSLATGTKQKQL